MSPEAIFTLIFIAVILLIPFGLRLNLSRAIRKRKDIEGLFSDSKYNICRVIGYTERKKDTENIGDYYPVLEYVSEQGERIWAEGDSCDKDFYAMGSSISIMFHPRDNKDVMCLINDDVTRARVSIDKNIEIFFNFLITVFVISGIFYYKGNVPHLLAPLILSYAAGLISGVIFGAKKSDEKSRIRLSQNGNKRLITAQEKGYIPCFLYE